MNEEFNKYWDNEEYQKLMMKASSCYANSMSKEELESCKMLGLLKFVEKFDEKRAKWTTFLYLCVSQECQRFLKANSKFYRNHITNCNMQKMTTRTDIDMIDFRDFVDSLSPKKKKLIKKLKKCHRMNTKTAINLKNEILN